MPRIGGFFGPKCTIWYKVERPGQALRDSKNKTYISAITETRRYCTVYFCYLAIGLYSGVSVGQLEVQGRSAPFNAVHRIYVHVIPWNGATAWQQDGNIFSLNARAK